MGKKKETIYYKFVKEMLKALHIAHVRRYPKKHDPRKYGIWAHACILALKELEDKTYRFIADMVSEMANILSLLGISQSPHWTILHKAAMRFRGSLIERFVRAFVQRTKSQSARAGIDSTGLQPTRASAYYTSILKRDRKKRRKIRKHIKLSTVVDLDHLLPMIFKVRRGPASDYWDSLALVRKAHRIKKLKSLDADKGYTSERLRKYVVERCKSEDRIKVKNPDVSVWKTKGQYLKKAKRRKLRANYRALCETYHSVLKRVTGNAVMSVKVIMQNKEVAFKVLACSALRRAMSLLFREVFYRTMN